MCFSVSYLTQKNEVYARRLGIDKSSQENFVNQVEHLRNLLGIAWFKSGFEHPGLPILTDIIPNVNITAGFWGLIPHWVRSIDQQKKIINLTLNARIETLDEKPSFRNALNNRCLLMLDGFFEYQHEGNKVQPYLIFSSDKKPMFIAGIFENAPDTIPFPFSLSIVTRPANKFMTEMHGKSKSGDSRMPAILDDDSAFLWLNEPFENIKNHIANLKIDELHAIPVRQLTGKYGVGNSPKAHEGL